MESRLLHNLQVFSQSLVSAAICYDCMLCAMCCVKEEEEEEKEGETEAAKKS